jgi:hypothetical protein
MEGQEVLVLEGSGGVYISPGVLYLNMKRKGENLQLLHNTVLLSSLILARSGSNLTGSTNL